MNKQQLLEYLENRLYVCAQPSPIHGIGVFAVRDIPKGVDPFQSNYEEDTIEFTRKELNHLPPRIMKMIEDYCAEDQGKYHIPTIGFNPIELGRYINHSKTPNTATDKDGWHFVTLKEIKAGEELVVDFHTYNDDHTVLLRDRYAE
ncbi:SET domain-containing protein-lysine N-methyltransferase [Candidatus Microgenomates bacterium]|nr:SET domain-containing protein-lysine N-methyltransferase [Candidatus Microgenomates bacterium]